MVGEVVGEVLLLGMLAVLAGKILLFGMEMVGLGMDMVGLGVVGEGAEDMAAEDMAAEDMAAEDMAAEDMAAEVMRAEGIIEKVMTGEKTTLLFIISRRESSVWSTSLAAVTVALQTVTNTSKKR